MTRLGLNRCGFVVACAVLGCGGGGGGDDTPDAGSCGNGILQAGEDCDDGAANSDTAPNACRTNCDGIARMTILASARHLPAS